MQLSSCKVLLLFMFPVCSLLCKEASFKCNLCQIENINSRKRMEKKRLWCWRSGPFYLTYLIMHFLLEHDWFSVIFRAFTLVDSAVRGRCAICPSAQDAELYVAGEPYVCRIKPACVRCAESRCSVLRCRSLRVEPPQSAALVTNSLPDPTLLPVRRQFREWPPGLGQMSGNMIYGPLRACVRCVCTEFHRPPYLRALLTLFAPWISTSCSLPASVCTQCRRETHQCAIRFSPTHRFAVICLDFT